jgi:hypothetical protein
MAAEFIELTPQRAVEIARRFNVSVEEVQRQYAIAQQDGVETTLAQMDDYVTEIEGTLNRVIGAVELDPENRVRGIGDFYQELVEQIDTNDPPPAADLLLQLAIAVYQLTEARAELAKITDSGHR